jgi:hypothetical protein
MSSISNTTHTTLPTRAHSLDDAAPRSPVGRLSSQRTITRWGAGDLGNEVAPTRAAAPVRASSTPTRRFRVLRVVTGCALGAAVGVMIGGPIGIVAGAAVGSAYVIIGPKAIAQSIQKVALIAYQHIQHHRASRQPAASV